MQREDKKGRFFDRMNKMNRMDCRFNRIHQTVSVAYWELLFFIL
jgi:hypothetical protein